MQDKQAQTERRRPALAQILWSIAAAVLLLSALLVLLNGHTSLVTLATPLGVAMLLSGCVNVFIYKANYQTLQGAHWLLADGLGTALLATFLLFNQMIEAAIIPFFFGMWDLFSGIIKLTDTIDLKKDSIRGWYAFAGISFVELISGIAALLKPVDEFVGMHGVIAFVLLIQSCGYLCKVFLYPQLARKA